MEQLLTAAAEMMCGGAAASACMITYHPPHESAMSASHGMLTEYVRHELRQAESRLSPRQTCPLWHECADVQLLTMPLSAQGTHVGALHFVAPDPMIALDELDLAANLLIDALTRQITADRAERRTRTQLDVHLSLHSAVTGALAESAPLEETLTRVLRLCCEHLGWDLGVVWGADPQTAALRSVATWQAPALEGELDAALDRQALSGARLGLAGRAWTSGGPLWVDGELTEADLLGSSSALETPFRAACAVPLHVGGERCGVLGLFSRAARSSDPHLVALLTTFGSQIGQYMRWKHAEAEALELAEALRIERERLLRREVEVRTQMARDLHDGPAQQVAVAELNVQYVRRVAERAPEQLSRALDGLAEQLRRATQDLRTVLYELRPLGIAEEGLVVVLHKYVARFYRSDELLIHLDAPTSLRRLPVEAESAVFIIIQEALSNVRKHAAASDVWIRLREDGAALAIEIRDNGRGFDVQHTQGSYMQRGSFGLLNMRERAQLIGGSWSIHSQPGQGTAMQLRVPFGG
ncbi:MAG TPA: GAF domain-containing sensor histidine kinase [Herpetosiphonaceae bacterium]